ncbi:hypothetical protein KUW00_06670 [Halomonas sp. DP5N14-9]|uniref:hypothetical protein n=1 Tax=Halomonas sp. DP5N14-9 TaxID=2859075 RepID=UPI001C996DE8|nr:hypothetical protein [Halomonas sp. DP5N14-9]MBY5940566.1 hypothetical protein [Halomonas sp. DP5N14-9]
MKVHLTSNGYVSIELESQCEIDGLWVLAGHVSGDPTTMRSIFSCPADDREGLYELLAPHVSSVFMNALENGEMNVPRETTELLLHHQQHVRGAIHFEPMPGRVSDPRPHIALGNSTPLLETEKAQ